MKSLGEFKEIVTAGNHVPARWHFDLSQQWYKAVQHFRHAAANGRRVHHLGGLAAEAGGEEAKFIQGCLANDGLIVTEFRGRGRSRGSIGNTGWFLALALLELQDGRCRRLSLGKLRGLARWCGLFRSVFGWEIATPNG